MEANIAYYCLHKLHRWPHEFLDLDKKEKAFVIAAVHMKLEHDKKAAQKARASGRKR